MKKVYAKPIIEAKYPTMAYMLLTDSVNATAEDVTTSEGSWE